MIAIGIIFAAIATILLKKEAIAQKKISLSVLINEIKSIKELNVIENDYKILVKADEKEKDCHVFCSEKSYIAVCDYTMKIKFDLEQVSVDINGQDIVVTYPHPEISSNERREDTPCRIFKDEDTTQEFRSNAMNSLSKFLKLQS